MGSRKITCMRSIGEADGFTVMDKHDIQPNAEGCIFWHVVNFSDDMEKDKIILAFKLAFERWQACFDQLPPVGRFITFQSTDKYDEAHIRLLFLKPGAVEQVITRDDGTVMKFVHKWPFDGMGGVVAHVPYTETNIYFDDGENWSEMFEWRGDDLYVPLLETVLHEFGHCLDLGHTKAPNDIMAAKLDEVKRDMTQDTFDGLVAAGWSEKKKQFFKPAEPVTTPVPMSAAPFKVLHIQDQLPKGPKPYAKRSLSSIDQIVVHHSADNGTVQSIANYHTAPAPVGHGWPGIGYTFIIDKAGTIYQVNDLDTLCFNVAQQNSRTLGICLIGNYEKDTPPEIQVSALKWLIPVIKAVLGDHPVKGHLDTGVATSCPGKNLYSLINSLQ